MQPKNICRATHTSSLAMLFQGDDENKILCDHDFIGFIPIKRREVCCHSVIGEHKPRLISLNHFGWQNSVFLWFTAKSVL